MRFRRVSHVLPSLSVGCKFCDKSSEPRNIRRAPSARLRWILYVETKAIYSILHTISHLLIKSAGINSGISKEGFAEIIFPNIPAIFIYPTSEQGHVLGSVSGMFENNYRKFISDAFENFEQCSFDPICTTHHDGSCFACTMLSEVSCEHFNKDLSRKYLYGGVIDTLWPDKINIEKGFWK